MTVNLVDSLNDSTLSYSWQYYPLTTFPTLKGQNWPWIRDCEGNYLETGNPNHVFCKYDVNHYYVGTYVDDKERNITLYRCEKFIDTGKGWLGIGEYLAIVSYGDIIGIFYKSKPYEKLKLIKAEDLY